MKDWRSQSHVRWDCKYHLVILPKYRQRKFFGSARRQSIELLEGNALPDHLHLLLSVPPKYSIAMTVGYLKGKSAVRIHRELLRTKGTLFGRAFWSRGYCVSTVGLDQAMITRYIQEQEKDERDQERGLFGVD
jgi:putative transposase